MKILSINKYEKEQLEINTYSFRKCICEVVSKEQAEKEKWDIYINDRWHYVIGHDEINFIFLNLKSYPLYGVNEQITDILYELDILINRELYKILLLRDEISNKKWLRNIKTQDLLVISNSKYEKLLKAIQPQKGEKICFESIGIHKVENRYFYVTSNCAITSSGINKEIRALKEGFDLEFDESVKEEKYAEKFLRYNMMNLHVFYPIHYMQIIAVLRYFLKEHGISAGAILWIDGVVASGKTELSFTMGDMFNRCGNTVSMKKNLYSTKIKTNELEKKLTDYQNAVLILDDVKKEETVRNRENTKNVTDLVVRSIYMGRLGKEQSENDIVNASAIITGEFFKEQMSTISRILYLNIGNFLQENQNSACFKEIQSDKTYFAGFMRYFIQWIFKNIEGEKQNLYLERIIKNVSELVNNYFINGELSTRMKELYISMLICTQIVSEYLKDVLGHDNCNANKFDNDCKEIINNLIRDTWNKSLNYKPLYHMAFDNIILSLKIKDCRYGEKFLDAINYDISSSFAMMDKKERGISYNDHVNSKEKAWLLRLTTDYAGLLLNFGKEDILIIRQDEICEQMREYIEKNKNEWNIHFYPSDYQDDKIITELINSQRIFAHKRSDNTFDRIFNYPLVQDNSRYKNIQNENLEIELLQDIKMVKVNVMYNSKNIIDRLEKKEIEKTETWLDVRDELHHNYDYSKLVTKTNTAIEKINKFLDLK
ncbi:MAG: hypothetical protein HFJ07_13655 [Lachnospiraceae bacterium]|nr:hypothetical protein [Lachnospiraceae bacterium]